MAIKSKKVKITGRERSKLRIRKRISGTDIRPRISVFKSAKHIYVQAISDESGKTIASASTKDTNLAKKMGAVSTDDLPNDSKSTKSVLAARAVGNLIAERIKEKGVEQIVFDRNGYVFHGRVKGIVEGLREGGLTV